MNLKPYRQLRPPKGRGTISSKIIKKAVKKVAAKRELVEEPGHKWLRDSSSFKDFDTKLHGSLNRS